jgi:opacity protein-like surface antigen
VIALTLLILLVFCSSPQAFVEKGTKEISIGGSLTRWKVRHKEPETNLNAYFRAGIMASRRVGAEAEFFLTKLHEQATCHEFNVNLTCNFPMTTSKASVDWFLLAGAGTSNSLPYAGYMNWTDTGDWRALILNAGGGMKILFNDWVAFRIEYRYQTFFVEVRADSHRVLMGVSAIFAP